MSIAYDEYLKKHISTVHKLYDIIYGEPWEKDHKYSHDGSKYTKEEYPYYDLHWYGERSDDPRELDNYNKAWLHHCHFNAHHWEHWVAVDEGRLVPVEMDEFYLRELVCDWASFSFLKKNPEGLIDWWEDHKENIILHPNTKEKLLKELPRAVEKMKKYFGNLEGNN